MKTTVMFVADSEPLGTVPVRLADNEGELYTTDEEGKIEFELEPGTHTFYIQHGDDWIERTVHREGHAPLFVVNVRSPEAPDVSTMNTLQIDLANLVGDRYVFETVLGRGGMGIVVKAVDRMLNRPVAIKMLSDELQDNEEAQQIFLVEARNLATLSHPNLVAIHDILNVSGRVLMIFEYVLGENVEKQIKRDGRLGQKDVLRIAIQLTRCVAYLHEHDLIHRDLKPANIIMQADGTLKLIDFGLARSLNELYIRGTRVRGTPAYMAPEQIQGIHLTTSTDLYQIGISMYEMLAGALPFSTGDMAYAHVHLEPPPLREKVPDVDAKLAQLIHACLSKKPGERPDSAEELLSHLQAIYARIANRDSTPGSLFEASTTGPLPALEPSQPSIAEVEELSFADEVTGGTNRGLILIAVVGVLALATAVYVWQRTSTPPVEATTVENTTTETTETTEVEPEAKEMVIDIEPSEIEEPGMLPGSIGTAQNLIDVSVTAAKGQATGQASALLHNEEKTKKERRPTRRRPVRNTKPKKRKTKAKPTARPPSQPEDSEEVERIAQPKKSKSSDSGGKEEGGTDLLSVDDDETPKTLLPVNE